MDQDQIAKFLKIIAQIESSGGQNVNHETIQQGIHAGDAAVGQYGLMPNTIKEITNRMRLKDQLSPDLQQLSNMEGDQLKQHVASNPEQEQKLANFLANRVIERQGGDQEKAAYSWFQGHNLTPDRIEEQGYKDHDYVKKFNKIRSMFDSEVPSGE